MTTKIKTDALVRMFNCYPSTMSASRETAAATLAAYLEKLSGFPSEIVSSACDRASSKAGQFPPSAGDLFDDCERMSAARKRQQEWTGKRLDFSRYRLPPPKPHGYTVDQLADWSLPINHVSPYTMRVDAEGNPLPVPPGFPGAGQLVEYGYLTPAEIQASRGR